MGASRAWTGYSGVRRPAPGPTPTLSAAQLAQLPTLLERGAEAYGFRGQVWTCKRAAEVIRRTFGVSYHPAHVSRLLHPLRQSVQRPHARAAQRTEASIQAWWRERWPALEKKPPRKGAPSSG
jgi:transposase